jgi:hypothetical protein
MDNCVPLEEIIEELEKDPEMKQALDDARKRLAKLKSELTADEYYDYMLGHFIYVDDLPSNAELTGERSE